MRLFKKKIISVLHEVQTSVHRRIVERVGFRVANQIMNTSWNSSWDRIAKTEDRQLKPAVRNSLLKDFKK